MFNTNILENKTVKELKQICREQNIRGFSRLRKAELVELIASSGVTVETKVRLEDVDLRDIEYGIKDGRYYAVAYNKYEFEITEKDFYNIPADDIEDCFSGEWVNLKSWREGYEDAQTKRERRTGYTIPHLQSLEDLLLLPPSDFRELTIKLNCVQHEYEYTGEFYVRVWQTYQLGNHAQNIEDQESKGNYGIYHKMSQEDKDLESTPITDYEYLNQNEMGKITPTRTYKEWAQLELYRLELEEVYNASCPANSIDDDQDVLPF